MAINLVSTIMQSIMTPDMIAKVASLLGIDRAVAQKAIEAGIPAILAALASRVSTPDGARHLSNALAQQPALTTEQLSNPVGGPSPSNASEGTGSLSTLIGGADLRALAGAVGQFAGVNMSTGKSLLAMLAPLVTGALGQQRQMSGLDAGGLANLLVSQKDQIAAAMPPGVANMLSGTGLLDGLDDGMRRTADATSTAAGRFSGMADDAATRTGYGAYAAQNQSASPTTWPYWVGALAVILGLGLFLLPKHEGPQLAGSNPPTTDIATVGSRGPNVSAVDLARQLNSSVITARTTLLGMTDPASARASLPRLQQVTDQIDKINAMAEDLPPGARQGLATSIKPTMNMLDQLFDRILARPELADVAKPTIDSLRAKLQALSPA